MNIFYLLLWGTSVLMIILGIIVGKKIKDEMSVILIFGGTFVMIILMMLFIVSFIHFR